jgi:hypothetical protein
MSSRTAVPELESASRLSEGITATGSFRHSPSPLTPINAYYPLLSPLKKSARTCRSPNMYSKPEFSGIFHMVFHDAKLDAVLTQPLMPTSPPNLPVLRLHAPLFGNPSSTDDGPLPVKVSQGQSRLTEPRPVRERNPGTELPGSPTLLLDLVPFSERYGNPRKGTERYGNLSRITDHASLKRNSPKTLRLFTAIYASNFSRSAKWQRRPAASFAGRKPQPGLSNRSATLSNQ